MKVRFSDLLRWGYRDSGPGTAVAEAQSQASGGPEWDLGSEGSIWWINRRGELEQTHVRIDQRPSSTEAEGRAESSIPVGPGAWILIGEDRPRPARVVHCEVGLDGYRFGIDLETNIREVSGWGSAKLLWVNSQGVLVISPASIRNADSGIIEINAAESAPPRVLALLAGWELCCLCKTRSLRAYDDRFLLEIEPLIEPRTKTGKAIS